MEQKKTGTLQQPAERRLPALGGAFLLGAVAGSLLCARLESVQSWLQNSGQAPLTLWQILWPNAALLGVLLLSGFLRPGCMTALLTMAVKGFFLSAKATLLVAEQGSAGYAAVLSQELIPGFVALAALMLLGRQAMGWSVQRLRLPPGRGKQVMPDSSYFLTAAICLGLMVLSAALRLWLAPKVWTTVQTFLPAA